MLLWLYHMTFLESLKRFLENGVTVNKTWKLWRYLYVIDPDEDYRILFVLWLMSLCVYICVFVLVL